MNITILVDKFIMEKSAACAPRTVEYYRENLDRFINYLNESGITEAEDITREDYIEYIRQLRSRRIKNTSLRTYVRAVAVFSNWMYDHDKIPESFAQKVKLPKRDSSIVIPLNRNEVEKIDRIIDMHFMYALRNHLIFHLMLDCGLRRGEILNLKLKDINLDERYIVINNSKENKSRILPMPDLVLQYLLHYQPYRRKRHTYVLCNNDGDPLTANTIKQFFQDLKEYTGITRLHPHLLRHTFATSFVLGGGNMEILRVLMGHADYNITQNYLHIAAQMQVMGSDIYRLDNVFFKNYNN